MAITLTFNQAGLPAGATDRGRTDIRSDAGGARPLVDVLVGSIPLGSLVDVELIDEPPSSNPLLTEVTPDHWTLEFDAGCWGPFRVRAIATIGEEVVSTVTRRISIRSPALALDYPALAERYDPNARAVATAPSIEITEMNEGSSNRALVDFHRSIVEALEAGGEGGGGTITSIEPGPAVIVDNPTGPVVTVSLDFGAGEGQVPTASAVEAIRADLAEHEADTANPHLVTKAQIGLAAVTDDAQLKADWSGYPVKPTPTTADSILIADAAASGAVMRAAWSGGGGAGSAWSIAANVNPLHWWRVGSNTNSGGRVDTVLDVGRSPRTLGFLSGTRAALAVHANGKSYMDFSSGAGRYQAGTAAEAKHMHDGTAFTLVIVAQKTAWPVGPANKQEGIFSTMAWSSSSIGFSYGVGQALDASSAQVWGFECVLGNNGPTMVFGLTHIRYVMPTGVTITVMRFLGRGQARNVLNFSGIAVPPLAYSIIGEMWLNGSRCAAQLQNNGTQGNLSTANPAGPYTIGAYTDGGAPYEHRVFDVLIEDRALSDYSINQLVSELAAYYQVAI